MEWLVTCILLFLCPLLLLSLQQDQLIQSMVQAEAARFVENIREQGVMTKDAYLVLQRRLSMTGMAYSVELRRYTNLWELGEEPHVVEQVQGEDELLQQMEQDGSAEFLPGDFFLVRIQSLNRSPGRQMFHAIVPMDQGPDITVVYGGGIRNAYR